MKIVILDAKTFGDSDLSGFDALGEVVIYQTTTPNEVAKRIKNADVIVTNKVVIDENALKEAKNLKLICVAATGTNNIDFSATNARGITVKNVSGYSSASVAQLTFTMALYLLNSPKYYDEFTENGSWCDEDIFTHIGPSFSEINGKNWGIIGLGEIGLKVAGIVTAFGANVRYYSTSGKNDNKKYKKVTLSELLEDSDIISIHAPLSSDTKNLISHSELLCLKDGALLLNLGRGGIIDEEALSVIIDAKPIFVGLDVLENEPMRANHPLLSIKHKERLFITPHIAWTSREARAKLINMTIENIKSIL